MISLNDPVLFEEMNLTPPDTTLPRGIRPWLRPPGFIEILIALAPWLVVPVVWASGGPFGLILGLAAVSLIVTYSAGALRIRRARHARRAAVAAIAKLRAAPRD